MNGHRNRDGPYGHSVFLQKMPLYGQGRISFYSPNPPHQSLKVFCASPSDPALLQLPTSTSTVSRSVYQQLFPSQHAHNVRPVFTQIRLAPWSWSGWQVAVAVSRMGAQARRRISMDTSDASTCNPWPYSTHWSESFGMVLVGQRERPVLACREVLHDGKFYRCLWA